MPKSEPTELHGGQIDVTPPRRGSTGARLSTSPLIEVWRDRVSHAHSPHVRAALNWFVALDALSEAEDQPAGGRAVTLRRLSQLLGEDAHTVYSGRVWRLHDDTMRAMSVYDVDTKSAGSLERLYRQARMATFLHYRDGFIEALERVPFTGEAALHGYVRVALEWARRWSGLAAATPRERRAQSAAFREVGERARITDREVRIASTVMPVIVEQDLRDLLHVAGLEASDISSTAEGMIAEEAATAMLTEQISLAASYVRDDPTLTALTAGNLARATANDALGGALLRMRVRRRDAALLQDEVLNLVRERLLQPRAEAVRDRQVSGILAELEQQLASVALALRAIPGGEQ